MDNLKELRIKKGFTQVELARAVGVSLAAYLLWERGVGSPKPENMDKLKKVLEIS